MNKTYREVLNDAAALQVPADLDLRARIMARLQQRRSFMQTLRARPALAIALVILALLLLTGAAYAIGRLTGYIPGVGLIDQSAPLRVLAEPVTITRNDITVTVEQAVLSADKAVVILKTEGVPMEAYPKSEADPGCMGKVNLRLSDGSVLDGGYMHGGNWSSFRSNLEYGPVPANVNEASVEIACIGGTEPGALPTDWEIPIRFVPAPPDLTVVPVIDVSTPTAQAEATTQPAPVHIDKALQIGDDYILMGTWDASISGPWMAPVFPDVTDASGQKVVTSIPDIQGLPPSDWSIQFKGAGIAYPITLSFTSETFSTIPDATAEFVFDAGNAPQMGQQWTFNKDLDMGGHTVRLVSITATSGHGYPPPSGDAGGYAFEFETAPEVRNLSVNMPGYEAMGGGGGGANGHLQQNLEFLHRPTGNLRVVLSGLAISGKAQTWKLQWQPETPPAASTAAPEGSAGACNIGSSFEQLATLPADVQGRMLLYRQTGDQQTWGLVLSTLDGSQAQVVVPEGNWGALSPDGGRVVYSGIEGALHVIDLTSGAERALNGTNAYDPVWSPDGTRIAYIDSLTVGVMGADGSGARSLTKPDHYAIAGWSADGAKVYFTVLTADGFTLQTVDVTSGEIKSLFTLQDSSRKAPDATISPDGNWIAYRSSNNGSLYLVRPDGSGQHALLTAEAISGLVWSKDSKWLGVSVLTSSDQRQVILLEPATCQAYLMPNLQGDLEGLSLP